MDINTRGTFLCSKYCIPHLKESKNPHILTISPPLNMGDPKTNWFARIGTGYVLAKYGMTLLTHGMSEELLDYGIGCNTLWPRTAIATAAVQNLLGGDSVVTDRESLKSWQTLLTRLSGLALDTPQTNSLSMTKSWLPSASLTWRNIKLTRESKIMNLSSISCVDFMELIKNRE